jgi:[acyl-carrier-protein] S-malonyltransferase
MGADVAAGWPQARAIFEEADDVLGYPLSTRVFTGEQAALDQTALTQPALYATSIAILRAVQAEVPHLPVCAAGHSLGELSALTAAGALDFAPGLRLVAARARAMTEAGERTPGAMAAVLGIEAEALRAACAQASAETGRVVVVANDNAPGQLVVSGAAAALARLVALAKAGGARRVIPLAVSIAAHSPLMVDAAAAFAQAVAETAVRAPRFPVFANTSAAPLADADAVRRELTAQLTGPVRWTETVRAMRAAGTALMLEIGPKDVLTGLLRRIDEHARGMAVNNAESLHTVVHNLSIER